MYEKCGFLTLDKPNSVKMSNTWKSLTIISAKITWTNGTNSNWYLAEKLIVTDYKNKFLFVNRVQTWAFFSKFFFFLFNAQFSANMSCSGDSLFEEDKNVILDDQEEIDYYAILNVPRDVSF